MRGAEEAFQGSRRFELRGRLGDGGGGVVYRAFDRSLNRDVALKLLRDVDGEGEGFTRIRASFSALRQLKHPNLVQLHDLVEENGRALLVMELVEGVSLIEFVRPQAGGFDEQRLRASFAQLAQALRALHLDRKVHRDVKPSNVRVTQSGRVVLLDLDFALDLDSALLPSDSDVQLRPIGTALYMAPEQAASRELKPSSDWYALGVVLYEALTGALPHRGSDLEVLMAKQDGGVVPPRTLNARVPVDLNDLCVALLAPSPEDRPTGSQVLARLGVPDGAVTGRFSLASLVARRSFVGRGDELGRLHLALDRSRRDLTILRVTGEAGIGKTALCAEFARRLEHDPRRVLVLRSTCPRFPGQAHAPFHGLVPRIVEALRSHAGSPQRSLGASAARLLERMFPGALMGLESLAEEPSALPPDPLEQRWRAIAALRLLLTEAAREHPLLLWLDDYHWADADTQRLVTSLSYGFDAPRMLVLLSEELEPGHEVRTEPAAHETIALRQLSPEEAALLRERALEHGGFSQASRAVSSCGLPLLIQERFHYVSFFGQEPDPDAPLSQLIMHRVQALPEPSRQLLELVCAAHDPVPQDVCERAAELARADFARHLAKLEASALLRRLKLGSEDVLVAEHALIADCVDLELSRERRAQVHQKLAAALVTRDPVRASGRLLRHQGESGDHAAAAQSAQVAAEQAHEGLAFQRAAELFMLWSSLEPPSQDEAGHHRLRRMAEALASAGWSLQAATIYRQAAVGAQSADALHMRQRAVEHLLRSAELVEGLDAVRELLASVDAQLPKTQASAAWSIVLQRSLLRLRGLRFGELEEGQVSARELRRVDVLWSSGVQLSRVDVVRGTHFLTRGLSEALKLGEPFRVARALCTEAWTRALEPSGVPRAKALIDKAEAVAARHPAPALDGYLSLARGVTAFGTYELEDCARYCREAEQIFRDHCKEVVWETTAAASFQLLSLSHLCRFNDQGAKLELALRESNERGDVWGSTYCMSIGAMGVVLAADRPDLSKAYLREAEERWATSDEFHFQHMFALIASVYVDLYLGDQSALGKLHGKWGAVQRMLVLRLPFVRNAMHELRGRAAIMAARMNKKAEYLEAAAADERQLLKAKGAVARGFANILRANIAMQRGQREQAAESLRTAVGLLEGRGPELWAHCGRLALGGLLGGDEGAQMRSAAEAVLRGNGVRDLERWQAMMMPGFVA